MIDPQDTEDLSEDWQMCSEAELLDKLQLHLDRHPIPSGEGAISKWVDEALKGYRAEYLPATRENQRHH
jgi:hypothetical protein